jgi:structural maintenance of chromosome 1
VRTTGLYKKSVQFSNLDSSHIFVFCRVSLEGSSEYRLNNKVVTYKNYNDALQRENILVQAKNFLVFQGDVEAIASQSPKDLTKLIERISGSLELAREYDEAKKAQDKATESSTFNFTKRRGIMAEIKQFKEQKTEADKFEKLLDDRVRGLLSPGFRRSTDIIKG